LKWDIVDFYCASHACLEKWNDQNGTINQHNFPVLTAWASKTEQCTVYFPQ
jgi:hypothetical protein